MSLPPSEIPQGAIRFNTDSQRLEFYAQGEWWVMSTDTPNLGRDVDSTPGARGVFGRQYTPSILGKIEYLNISTTGSSQEFGELTIARHATAGCSSSTRGVFGGGHTGPALTPLSTTNVIQYITIASLGNAIDFGDLTQDRERFHGTSNGVRGIFGGGQRGNPAADVDTIDYVTIATTGNAADFGNLTDSRMEAGACSDSHGGLGD